MNGTRSKTIVSLVLGYHCYAPVPVRGFENVRLLLPLARSLSYCSSGHDSSIYSLDFSCRQKQSIFSSAYISSSCGINNNNNNSNNFRILDRKPSSLNMLGAIVGDIAGSTYERCNCKSEQCPIFAPGSTYTDDSVLTLATCEHFLSGISYTETYQTFGRKYRYAGYGYSFSRWLQNPPPRPYNSWGNGSAMRASPIGWVAKDLNWALEEAKRSAEVTHDHPEGVKGAQAVVAAVFMARNGKDKKEIKTYIADTFQYDLNRTVKDIRPTYTFDVSCQGSVPEAIIAFLDSSDFEDAIRKAISLGGDSDTIACIAGAIAHAFYGTIPKWMVDYSYQVLDPYQRSILIKFCENYLVKIESKAEDTSEK